MACELTEGGNPTVTDRCRDHAEAMQSVLKLVGHVLQTGRVSFPGPGEITGAGKHEAMKATTTTLIVTLKKAKLQQR